MGPVEVIDEDPFRPIRSLMASKQIQVDASEFHAAVNEVFHAYEAPVYDEVHRDMWRSLPMQFRLLSYDLLDHDSAPTTPRISLLDVGCGTGLATDLLLRSPLGRLVKEVTLLDPSPEMMRLAERRGRNWEVDVRTRIGLLQDVPEGVEYDLVVACSLLHHIPDLADFCRELERVTRAGGHLLHLHDPNGDVSNDGEMAERELRLRRSLGPRSTKDRFSVQHVKGKLRSMFPGLKKKSYLDGVNRELRRRGLISSNLSPEEIWRITDLRVYDDIGIRMSQLEGFLRGFGLVSHRSYGFFGRPWSALPRMLRHEEERMTEEGRKDGAFVAALWVRLR